MRTLWLVLMGALACLVGLVLAYQRVGWGLPGLLTGVGLALAWLSGVYEGTRWRVRRLQ